jgi:DNA-binding NarL/FixJ family response regulator
MSKNSILVIEDEEIIRHTLKEDLSYKGYLVTTAINGEEGVKKFSKDIFDLVIVDLIMEGMSGIQAIKKIKQIRSDIPVIILTGNGSMDSAVDALRLGVLDYFLKPYPRMKFLQKVDLYLMSKSYSTKKGLDLNSELYKKMNSVSLTKREIEVCLLMREGLVFDKIAESLFISKHTLKNHLKSIYKKCEVNSGIELVVLLNH